MAEVKEIKSKVLVAEIADKRPTNFILEQSEETGFPVRIETSHARAIKSTSSILVRKGKPGKPDEWDGKSEWEVRRIRYIKGCPTIFVDEQNEKGYKPNGAQDKIWIENGTLNVTRDAMNKALYDYILHYEGNGNFPVTETKQRPENALEVYKLLDTEAEAVQLVDTFDDEVEAMNLLQGLKIKSTGNEVSYNVESLEFLSSLFRLPAYPSGFGAEVFVHLTRIAKENPRTFIQTIANERSVVEADINKAGALGVITIDQSRVFFTKSQKQILEFSGVTEKERAAELVDFMANPKNTLFYGQLRSEVKAKQIEATSKI